MASRLDIAAQALHRRADAVECWDDDPDFAELDQIQHPPATATTPTTTTAPVRAGTDYSRREPSSAVSSRRSTITSAYDLDALEEADREHQIPFDGSPAAAIKSAQSAGIPIPENVPFSALVGGTIKRLGPSTRARKVTMHDDWGEDLEFPSVGNAFTVKTKEFPQSLHHMPSKGKGIRNISPSRVNLLPVTHASEQLNRFRDMPEDEMFFGECDELPSLKVFVAGRAAAQGRGSNVALPTPPLSESAFRPSPTFADDDFDADFEFPADAPLQLGGLREMERSRPTDFHTVDMGFEDWGDGDSGLGSSYAGTRGGADHGAHSVVSPSVSAMTMGSEDDMPFEGLVLPGGVLPDFHRVLERRRRAAAAEAADYAPAPINQQFHAQKDFDDPASEEEFFEGIEIGDVFDSKKLSLNGNVRRKQQPRKPSPIRRTAMSLTFTTNKPLTPQPSAGRLNRLTQGHPALLPSAPLEPVAERENQPSTVKRIPRNRWGSADYRWNGGEQIPPPPPIPRTDRTRTLATDGRRNLAAKSTRNLRGENAPPPTTTHAQLLRAKRSMPNIQDSPNSQKGSRPQSRASNGRPPSRSSSGRPPSSGNTSTRPTSTGARPSSSGTRPPPPTSTGAARPTNNASRPTSTGARTLNPSARPPSRTSNGRPPSRNDRAKAANAPAVRHPAPFMCGGGMAKTSHHVAVKTSNKCLDNRGEGSITDRRPNSRLQNRNTPRHSPSSSGASNATAKRITPTIAPEQLRREAANIGTLTQPTRKRNFGDGTELEIFDDLPTNAKVENSFTKTPAARGVLKPRPKSMPNRETESPRKKKQQHEITPRQDDVPRFARDTTGMFFSDPLPSLRVTTADTLSASRKAREITQQRLGMGTPIPQSPIADRWRSKIAARSQATPRALPKKTSQHKPHLIKPMGNITTLPKGSFSTFYSTGYHSANFRTLYSRSRLTSRRVRNRERCQRDGIQ